MLFAGCEQVVDDGFNIVTAAIRVYESMAAGFHTFKVPAGRFLFMQFVGGFYIGIWENRVVFCVNREERLFFSNITEFDGGGCGTWHSGECIESRKHFRPVVYEPEGGITPH